MPLSDFYGQCFDYLRGAAGGSYFPVMALDVLPQHIDVYAHFMKYGLGLIEIYFLTGE